MATAVQVESLWNGLTDNNGQPLAAGKVFTYAAGTSTPVSLFTASDKSTSATNPLILDAYGKAQVWADGRYKFVVKTAADVTLYTLDNLLYGFDDTTVLYGGTSTGSANAQTVSVPATVTSYANGQTVSFVAGFTNTGATTLQFNSLSAINLVKGPTPSSLQAGDLIAGQLYTATYHGGTFRLQDYPSVADVQRSRYQLATSVTGTNTITANLTPAPSSYETGMVVNFIATATNTGAVTLNLNGLGAKTVQERGTALTGSELVANRPVQAVYDGTNFQIISNNLGSGTASSPAMFLGDDTNTGVFGPAADNWAVATNGTERVRVDNNGATGISTQGDTASETVPGLGRPQLQVKGTGTIGQIAVFSRPGNGDAAFLTFCKSRGSTTGSYTAVQGGDGLGQIGFLGATGTDFRQGALIAGVQDGGTISATSMPGRLIFATTPNGDTVPAERMRIDSAGRVGIGTTVSSTPLTVGGASQPIAGAATNPGTIQIRESNITALTTSGGLEFYGSGSGSGYGCRIVGFDNGSMVFAYRNSSATWTESARIDNAGFLSALGSRNRTTALAANCHIDSTDGSFYRSTSSLKYKTDVRDYDKGLESVLSLRPVYYKGKTNGDVQFAGLIAEEVDAAGLTEFVMYDEEGSPDALAYQNMVALLVNSVKELNAKVESLEARLAALETV